MNFNFKDSKGSKLLRDSGRYLLLAALAMLALVPMWEASQVVFYFMGVAALFGIIVHALRRIFFPHISMDDFAEKAKETPLSAAIVFFSLTLFICTLFSTASSFVGLK